MQFTQEDKDYIARALVDLPTSQYSRMVTINGISLPLKKTDGNMRILEKIYTRAERLAATDVSKFPKFHIEPGTHIAAACFDAIEQKYLPAVINVNHHMMYLFEDDHSDDVATAVCLWKLMRDKDNLAYDPRYHFEELGRD